MRISSDDHSLRISMESLKLNNSDQGEEQIRGNQPNLWRRQNNQSKDGQVDQIEYDWNQV